MMKHIPPVAPRAAKQRPKPIRLNVPRQPKVEAETPRKPRPVSRKG